MFKLSHLSFSLSSIRPLSSGTHAPFPSWGILHCPLFSLHEIPAQPMPRPAQEEEHGPGLSQSVQPILRGSMIVEEASDQSEPIEYLEVFPRASGKKTPSFPLNLKFESYRAWNCCCLWSRENWVLSQHSGELNWAHYFSSESGCVWCWP